MATMKDGASAGAPDSPGRADDNHIAIIGLGYVGLPLAVNFSEAGLHVWGVDAWDARVAQIAASQSPIDDMDDGRLAAALKAGLKVSGLETAAVATADVVIICVPTPIDESRDPDLANVLDAARFVGKALRRGQLIALQSTTFPGTTSGPLRQTLEQESGLEAGRDFDLAFVPERVNPGDPTSSGRDVPRLVGGLTEPATSRVAELFRHINRTVIELSSPDAAEMAKLLENIFRNVNIALVNQLAMLCERMGLDVWEVVDAAATKPFGFMPFRPGPGVGGHCIPVDPYYLAWRARQFGFVDRFVELAGDINMSMPRHVVGLVADALNSRGRAINGSRIGVVGVSFKPDVRDSRNSPAADVMALLRERGGEVSYHDPHVERFADVNGRESESQPLLGLIEATDVVLVLVAHRAVDWGAVYERASLVVDTVGTARHRDLRPDQVLLLGGGWIKSSGSQP
jgi:UDP-N-acetyl-D-glucosamine dehydrogenase